MNNSTPRVSVLALAYNHSRYLCETLDSIRRQSFQDFELFISDDASRDHSAQLIQDWDTEHQRANRLFVHAANRGLCATLNEMLANASGEYIQLIACDDHLLPECLDRKVRLLDAAQANVAAVYTDATLMDADGSEQPGTFLQRFLKKRPLPTGNLFTRLLLGNFLPGMSFLIRRECLQAVGGWDESLLFEDWDMWLRLSRRYEFLFDRVPSVRYRLHPCNLHRNMQQVSLQNYRILSKHRDLLRTRMRILLTIVRNRDDFKPGISELKDFLAWADDYPETRWFRQMYFGRPSVVQQAVSQLVETSEALTRPWTGKFRPPSDRVAA